MVEARFWRHIFLNGCGTSRYPLLQCMDIVIVHSALCHPVQYSLILFCITQTLYLLHHLPTRTLDTQVSRSHQRRQANMFNLILWFLVQNTNPNINGANKVFCFGFFSPPPFISLQQSTIDVSTSNIHFHGHGITKAITLGFEFHTEYTWECTASSSLGEWGTADRYITSHYWHRIILTR